MEKPTSGYNWFSLLLSSRDSLSQMKLDERKKKTEAHTLIHDTKQEFSGSLSVLSRGTVLQLEDFTPFLALYTHDDDAI